MIKILLGSLVLSLALLNDDCGTRREQAAVASKEGDSCLVQGKCKVVFRRWEDSYSKETGGNVFYQCWVSPAMYNLVTPEDKVLVDVNSKDCEKVNP